MDYAKIRSVAMRELGSLIEAGSRRALTADEEARFASLEAEVQAIDQRVSELEGTPAMMADDVARGGAPVSTRRRSTPTPVATMTGRVSDSDLLRAWLRTGTPIESSEDRQTLAWRGLSPHSNQIEIRAQSKGAGAGAELVPSSLEAVVSRTLKSFAPIRNVARVIQTGSGETLRIPKTDDTSNLGEIIAENATNNEQDLTFTEISMGAYKYSSKIVRVSNELLQDSAIDLATFLGEILGERIGRIQSSHFINGTNSSQPQGAIAAAGTVTSTISSAISYNDIVSLRYAVDDAFLQGDQRSICWMANQTIVGALRKLADSQGNPIIAPMSDGIGLLLGYPIVIANEMSSSIAASNKVLAFGNFNQYVIRDAGSLVLARSVDRYFEYGQTAFLAVMRSDARYLQSGAVKVLQMATATTTTTTT